MRKGGVKPRKWYGSRLKMLFYFHNHTIYDIAEQIKTNKVYFYGWMQTNPDNIPKKSYYIPSNEVVERLAKFYNVSYEFFTSDSIGIEIEGSKVRVRNHNDLISCQ